MRAALRAFLFVLLPAAVTACAPTGSAPPGASREIQTCRPTIARMVPPQTVMDMMIGGMSPRPSSTPSREVWAASGNWIGNDVVWVSLPADGVFARKYHKLYSMAFRSGPITITGRHVDGSAAPVRVGSAMGENFESTVDFPEAGCWEVVYDFAGEQLRFTLKVVD